MALTALAHYVQHQAVAYTHLAQVSEWASVHPGLNPADLPQEEHFKAVEGSATKPHILNSEAGVHAGVGVSNTQPSVTGAAELA